MVEKRYKLHLTSDQLDILERVFDNHDWFCDCKEFPNCKDFKIFEKLKHRINSLVDRHFVGRKTGYKSYRKLKQKHMQEGADIVYKIQKEKKVD